jgi:hypothetical protein
MTLTVQGVAVLSLSAVPAKGQNFLAAKVQKREVKNIKK